MPGSATARIHWLAERRRRNGRQQVRRRADRRGRRHIVHGGAPAPSTVLAFADFIAWPIPAHLLCSPVEVVDPLRGRGGRVLRALRIGWAPFGRTPS